MVYMKYNQFGGKAYNAEELWNKYGTELLARLKTSKDEIMSAFRQADPTSNGKNTEWIIVSYLRGGIRIEDLGRVKTFLQSFIKLAGSKQLEEKEKELENYFGLIVGNLPKKPGFGLECVIDKYSEVLTQKAEKAKQNRIEQEEVEIVYEDKEIRVFIPKTEKASCYLGRGTQWCTAAKNDNKFKTYSNQGDLYIIIPKQPKYTGEKYQFHIQTCSFMDEQDESVELDVLFTRYPALAKIFQVLKEKQLYFKSDDIIIYMGEQCAKPPYLPSYVNVDNKYPVYLIYSKKKLDKNYYYPTKLSPNDQAMIGWESAYIYIVQPITSLFVNTNGNYLNSYEFLTNPNFGHLFREYTELQLLSINLRNNDISPQNFIKQFNALMPIVEEKFGLKQTTVEIEEDDQTMTIIKVNIDHTFAKQITALFGASFFEPSKRNIYIAFSKKDKSIYVILISGCNVSIYSRNQSKSINFTTKKGDRYINITEYPSLYNLLSKSGCIPSKDEINQLCNIIKTDESLVKLREYAHLSGISTDFKNKTEICRELVDIFLTDYDFSRPK